MLAPLSRSPASKEGSREMKRYHKSVDEQLDKLAPWAGQVRMSRDRLKRLGAKEGEVLVLLDPQDSRQDPLYKDAKTVRRNG